MTDLEELIQTCEKLCNTLDQVAQNEKKYTMHICMELERHSWDVFKMVNDIKEIKEYLG